MRTTALALPLAALAALAACAPEPDPTEPEVIVVACDASAYDAFIGQDEEIFARSTFPAPMRIIRAGEAYTQDFNPDRLNFVLGHDGTIVQVWCG